MALLVAKDQHWVSEYFQDYREGYRREKIQHRKAKSSRSEEQKKSKDRTPNYIDRIRTRDFDQ